MFYLGFIFTFKIFICVCTYVSLPAYFQPYPLHPHLVLAGGSLMYAQQVLKCILTLALLQHGFNSESILD